MKLKAVTVITASILIATAMGASWATYAGASWLLSAPAEQAATPAEPISPPITGPVSTTPKPLRAERYETVAAYFKAGNPNATTYRLGEPWIPRQSFSAADHQRIHEENGGCCQICGSCDNLEVEHWRGLQNGGGNERENLKTLSHDCHVQKTAMDKSLRRQRDKLLK